MNVFKNSRKALHGAVGIARATLGVDAVSADVRKARWATCSDCEFHDCGQCTMCGCFTGAKIRVASESCPAGKWLHVTVGSDRRCCGKMDNRVADLLTSAQTVDINK